MLDETKNIQKAYTADPTRCNATTTGVIVAINMTINKLILKV
jgi:hypothetical protein